MQILTNDPGFVRTTPRSWQDEVKRAIRTLGELRQALGLPAEVDGGKAAEAASQAFPVFVPQPWLERIERGNPQDPLLLQVLAAAAEQTEVAGFGPDPLAESGMQVLPGLLHKYQGRVLLIAAGACAIHCRYCFRRHFPYHEAPRSESQLQEAFERIAADPSIEEVLLSGGDPLMLTDPRLGWILRQLDGIPHLRRLRIHTRLPVAIPARITDELQAALRENRLQPVIVIHANHAAELDEQVAAAMLRLRSDPRITLLNQSVLLRGVNDRVAELAQLSRRLLDCGVLPYYLHLLDPVAGAAHFSVPEEQGLRLMEELRSSLPGYLVPRLVREIPGQPSKTPII